MLFYLYICYVKFVRSVVTLECFLNCSKGAVWFFQIDNKL